MGTKILIVDDDPVVRLLMQECLAGHGFEVSTLDSGQACLESLAISPPDVLVLDLLMPDMSGIDVMKKLKDSPTLAGLPVIVLSAHNDTEKILNSNVVHPDGVLQKPFALHEVLAAVRSIGAPRNE